ncbi:hypothetical protein Ddye_019175 [Dipteronia dyeriana]|uniref:Stress response protein NST1-like n=1 Tax=Dipteronia dyeriana TaxID=168575 RepID=A0AAD9WVS0_9ROSI|nr:hypothetical protein Ddye_019175 [Dipteronia dyeriana]
MKRKKWSEREEQTLLSKYSDLLNSGTLPKLKTREKKFRPIADHVNSVHHLQDPVSFPFKWSWRDVSIKVQNMRHQYLGVKQKIRISQDEFNWRDGENHWENFLKYKEVFGDVELEVKGKRANETINGGDLFDDCCDLGFAGIDSDDLEEEVEVEEEEEEEEEEEGSCEGKMESESESEVVRAVKNKKLKKSFGGRKGFGFLRTQVLDLRDVVVRREDKRREREFTREKGSMEREEKRRETELRKEKWMSEREEGVERRETESEETGLRWARKEYERRVRLENELYEERRKRMRIEEKREEEEMEWRERMVGLQIEHEKSMMQMQAEACQNQLQILGVMARLICQFFGSSNDGLGGGLGTLPPQVLQNLQHPEPEGLCDNGKPDANSPSDFL